MKRRFVFLTVAVFLLAGCAQVEIAQITKENPYKGGLRFYRPHPYLLVTKDKDGNLHSTIIWLPDKNEEYVLKVKSGIGSVNTQVTLTDGWNLTGLNETRDSKIPEMVTAITGALKVPTELIPKVAVTPQEPTPGLYRLDFGETSGFVKGLKPVPFGQ